LNFLGGKKQNNVKVVDKYKKVTQEKAKEAKLEKVIPFKKYERY